MARIQSVPANGAREAAANPNRSPPPPASASDSASDRRPLSIDEVLALERACLRRGTVRKSSPCDAPFPIGLALSGGGIRSATFSLGVLQALARERRLASFDYLSTVSGGGYIGAWLSAWIHRQGMKQVQDELGRCGANETDGRVEPEPVTWLRRYSNYLTPSIGTFSLDRLTVLMTWVRNVLLNLVLLLGALMLCFVVARLLSRLLTLPLGPVLATRPEGAAAIGFAAAWATFMAIAAAGYQLRHQAQPLNRSRNWLVSPLGVVCSVGLPTLLAVALGASWIGQAEWMTGTRWGERESWTVPFFAQLIPLVLLVLWTVADRGLSWWRRRSEGSALFDSPLTLSESAAYLLAGAAALAAGNVLIVILAIAWHVATLSSPAAGWDIWYDWSAWHDLSLWQKGLRQITTEPRLLFAGVGPLLILLVLSLCTILYTGLIGRVFYERSREWLSRCNAQVLGWGCAWALASLLAFHARDLIATLRAEHTLAAIAATGTWLGSLLAVVFGRRPGFASLKLRNRVDLVLNLLAGVFVFGLLVLTAAGTDWLLDHWPRSAEPVEREGWLAAVLLAVLAIFSWRIDINKFSLHNLYKNRLVRCYLGASNGERRNAQPFVGLDDLDDFDLALLGPKVDRRASTQWKEAGRARIDLRAQRPFHLLNTAVNLTQGSNLAWQERKAASFFLSPVACGYFLAGTQARPGETTQRAGGAACRTAIYGVDDKDLDRPKVVGDANNPDPAKVAGEHGLTLGMAMATSGAAVSPNMGYSSNPLRAFVLTMFNVRLGLWTPNPAGQLTTSPGPRFGLLALLQELLGLSNEERNYVYLSDGGHFDNLGLYELVRRRCKLIVAVDATADPDRGFDSLAQSLRMCRVDLGVEITFTQLDALGINEQGRSARGFVDGIIHYHGADPASPDNGRIVLIKPTMTGDPDEPADLRHYARRNPPFPHQGTADQFFGESQFESYRRLGLHLATQCLAQHRGWLPERVPVDTCSKPKELNEAPAQSTRWIALLLRPGSAQSPGQQDKVCSGLTSEDRGPSSQDGGAPSGRSSFPSRNGSLVDIYVISLLATVVGLVSFGFADRLLGGPVFGVCGSLSGCQALVRATLSGHQGISFWTNGRLLYLLADCAFVVLVALTFVSGHLAGIASWRQRTAGRPASAWRKVWHRMAGPVLIGAAGLAALFDALENALAVGYLISIGTTPESTDLMVATIAPVTLAKFVLLAINVLALAWLAPSIATAIRLRWRTAGAQA